MFLPLRFLTKGPIQLYRRRGAHGPCPHQLHRFCSHVWCGLLGALIIWPHTVPLILPLISKGAGWFPGPTKSNGTAEHGENNHSPPPLTKYAGLHCVGVFIINSKTGRTTRRKTGIDIMAYLSPTPKGTATGEEVPQAPKISGVFCVTFPPHSPWTVAILPSPIADDGMAVENAVPITTVRGLGAPVVSWAPKM